MPMYFGGGMGGMPYGFNVPQGAYGMSPVQYQQRPLVHRRPANSASPARMAYIEQLRARQQAHREALRGGAPASEGSGTGFFGRLFGGGAAPAYRDRGAMASRIARQRAGDIRDARAAQRYAFEQMWADRFGAPPASPAGSADPVAEFDRDRAAATLEDLRALNRGVKEREALRRKYMRGPDSADPVPEFDRDRAAATLEDFRAFNRGVKEREALRRKYMRGPDEAPVPAMPQVLQYGRHSPDETMNGNLARARANLLWRRKWREGI